MPVALRLKHVFVDPDELAEVGDPVESYMFSFTADTCAGSLDFTITTGAHAGLDAAEREARRQIHQIATDLAAATADSL